MNLRKIGYKLLSYWRVVFLVIVIYLSYGQTLNMYFWVDDWGIAYKMRYPEADIPNFGPGLFGNGAYRYNTTPFTLLYPIFGFNAGIYFLIGLFFYFICSLNVYLLAQELFQKKISAIISSVIFASGYIGSYAMYRLNNSYQLVLTATGLTFLSWLLLKHYKTSSQKYYFFALIIYTIILEFLFLRSHGIFLLSLSVSIIFYLRYKNISIKMFFLKQIPFFALWFYMFFIDERNSKTYDGLRRGEFLSNIHQLIIKDKHYELLNNFVSTFISTIFPDQLIFSLYIESNKFLNNLIETNIGTFLSNYFNIWIFPYFPFFLLLSCVFSILIFLLHKGYIAKNVFIYQLVGLITYSVFIEWSSLQISSVWSPDPKNIFLSYFGGIVLIILLSSIFVKKLKNLTSFIMLGLFWIITNILTYFIYNPTVNLESTNRYLIPVLVGSSLLFGGISDVVLSIQSKKNTSGRKILAVILLIYCSTLIFLSNRQSNDIAANVSMFIKNHFLAIERSGIIMNDKTIFYFDSEVDSMFRKTELGGIPHLAIPLALGYHGLAKIAPSSEELFYSLQEGKIDLNNIYTFYASGSNLINTTEYFRSLLLQAREPYEIKGWKANVGFINNACCDTSTLLVYKGDKSLGVNPVYEAYIDYPSLVPSMLTLELAVSPILLSAMHFPYYDFAKKYTDQEISKTTLENEIAYDIKLSSKNINSGFESAKDNQEFIEESTVYSDSEENSQEAELLLDKKFYTAWTASTKDWGKKHVANLYFSFNSPQVSSRFVWLNFNRMTAPTEYVIYASQDKIIWEKVKEVERPVTEERDYVVDEFEPTFAKYFKVTINQTFGGKLVAPSMNEAWFGNTSFDLNFDERDMILSCLICGLNNLQEVHRTYTDNAHYKVYWVTDENKNYFYEHSQEIKLLTDGKPHKYQVYIPAQGYSLKKIRLEGLNIPANVNINSGVIKTLSLRDLQTGKIVRRFSNQTSFTEVVAR